MKVILVCGPSDSPSYTSLLSNKDKDSTRNGERIAETAVK